MHPLCPYRQEAGIIKVMNANAIVVGLVGIVLLLIILKVFGLI